MAYMYFTTVADHISILGKTMRYYKRYISKKCFVSSSTKYNLTNYVKHTNIEQLFSTRHAYFRMCCLQQNGR